MILRSLLRITIWNRSNYKCRPLASEALRCHLRQRNFPHWTSYFVRYKDVQDDDFGRSHFNFSVNSANYHILRTGCYPFIKYHCSRRPLTDLRFEDRFFTALKLLNFGFPCLCYGIAAIFLIKHTETVETPQGRVKLYFLIKEDHNALN